MCSRLVGSEYIIPRYFFHVHDGNLTRDSEGTELPEIYAAQEEAIHLSGELLREMGGKFWDGAVWSLNVTDEAGRILFTLRFSAEKQTDLDST